MNKMRNTWKRMVSVGITMLMLLTVLLPFIPAKADVEKFTAEVQVGFDNKAEMMKYVPFMVTIQNNDEDFSGRLQLIVGNKANYNLMYETDISLAKGEKKTVNFACKIADNLGKINIRMANSKGKVIWSTGKRFSVDKTASQKIDIGILSDDFSALGYMDNVVFYDREEFKTNLVELTADNFPEDVNGLDMLEVIIISNFSTDILTDEQIEALNIWVNRGGMLIIGTGSNSSKTLSKLNENVINVVPGKMQRYTTSFGLNYYGDAVYSSGGNNGNNTYNDPYADQDYVEEFEEWYANDRQTIDELCLEDFMSENGLTEDDLEDDGSLPYYWEADYHEYCFKIIYDLYWNQNVPDSGTYSYPVVTADVLEFEDDKNSSVDRIYLGDCETGQYDLARVYSVAEGYVALFGIDFTMNPIPNYQDADGILKFIITDYVLGDVVEAFESLNDSGYYSYNVGNFSGNSYRVQDFLDKITTAPLPPMALYIIPILAYLVAILVLYLVNRKKNKTFRLWYWYPILAVGMAVVIYSIGFSTRIIKPRVNVMSVMKLNNPAAREMNYVGVTTPSNRICEVSFSDDYDIQLTKTINGYSYDQSDKVDMNTYRVAFRKGIDKTSVRFAGNIALSSDQFLLESIYPSERNFEIQYIVNVNTGETGAEKLIVRNNTGVDLEDVSVITYAPASQNTTYGDLYVYSLGHVKSGAAVDMSSVNWNSENRSTYRYADTMLSQAERSSKLLGFFFGSLSGKYLRYRNRSALADFLAQTARDDLMDEYNQRGTEAVYVIGFPKGSVCHDVQFDNKYRTERTEVVEQKIYYTAMQTVEKH